MPVHLSKLTATLQQLSEPEIAKLEAYLRSPYFETKSPVLVLFEYLKKLHPQFEEKKMDAAYMQKKVPALGDQRKQANYGSELLNATEHFLALEDFQANTDSLNRHRLQAYKKHHLFEQFNKEHEQLLKELDKNTEQDFETFYQRHILTELALTGFDTKLNRTISNDIHPVTETLDTFYAIKKLRYHCELLNRQQVIGTSYNEENIVYVLQVLEPYHNDKYPFVFLFVNVYQMLKAKSFEESEIYFQKANNFIAQHYVTTIPDSIKDVIRYMANYFQYWNSQGYIKAGELALMIQELKIKYAMLLEHGKIPPSDFRNIVSLAILNTKDAKWIKQFIDTFSSHLPIEHKEINQAFALAQYYYYTKNFGKAMPLFQQALAKEEHIFNAIVRRWQFMCLYEQDSTNTDVLSDFLIAYEKYILRYSDSFHQFKELFTKNISYSKKLLKANNREQQKELVKVLTDENYFTGKEWLLKQL